MRISREDLVAQEQAKGFYTCDGATDAKQPIAAVHCYKNGRRTHYWKRSRCGYWNKTNTTQGNKI